MKKCPEDYHTRRIDFECEKTTGRDRAAKALEWTSFGFSAIQNFIQVPICLLVGGGPAGWIGINGL